MAKSLLTGKTKSRGPGTPYAGDLVSANSRPGRLMSLANQELTNRGIQLDSDRAEEYRRFQWGEQVTQGDFQAHTLRDVPSDYKLIDDEPGRLDRQAPTAGLVGYEPLSTAQQAQADRVNMAGVAGLRPDDPFVDPSPGELDRQAPTGDSGSVGIDATPEDAVGVPRRRGSGGVAGRSSAVSGLLSKKKKTLLGSATKLGG